MFTQDYPPVPPLPVAVVRQCPWAADVYARYRGFYLEHRRDLARILRLGRRPCPGSLRLLTIRRQNAMREYYRAIAKYRERKAPRE